MNETPIQKLIKDLENLQKMTGSSQAAQIEFAKSLLPYEKQFAGKIWEAGDSCGFAQAYNDANPESTIMSSYPDFENYYSQFNKSDDGK